MLAEIKTNSFGKCSAQVTIKGKKRTKVSAFDPAGDYKLNFVEVYTKYDDHVTLIVYPSAQLEAKILTKEDSMYGKVWEEKVENLKN